MSARIRCAIYTRKSTEEGLEQDFNSLDAQREACEAFIQSQKGLGWVILKDRYDDGGLSGGTLERPALQALLADIEAGKIDLVVVYKVDRLTRSLMDFAKIIETFDAKNVSFVSVTQQFNTANSMGRLTLNVLLSFAQFEREVTAERIRDKIAASKKKGMWMGGLAPLGYDAVDKKLVVNEPEAEVVRSLFDLYLDLQSVRKLKEAADQIGLTTKPRKRGEQWTGGKPFTRGHLYQLLNNPIYAGNVRHKDETYPGEHPPIIDNSTWEAVQDLLADRAPARQAAKNTKHRSLLAGITFDETGDRLTPSFSRKGERRYRYYISKRLAEDGKDDSAGWRLPASELERIVVKAITDFLNDESQWLGALDLDGSSPDAYLRMRERFLNLAAQLASNDSNAKRQVIRLLVTQITVAPGVLTIILNEGELKPDLKHAGDPSSLKLTVPFHTKRRGVESKIIIGGQLENPPNPDRNLIDVVCRSFEWQQTLLSGSDSSIEKLAETASIDASDVTRFLPLAYLAPDIVEAILEGTQPIELTVERLRKLGPLPVEWAAQRELLGFQPTAKSLAI